MVDLNTRLNPAQPLWLLNEANGVNLGLQIIGTGTYNGEIHGFLLTQLGTSVAEIVTLLLLD